MIFDLQRYSTHDGPGIRTLVFLKGARWPVAGVKTRKAALPSRTYYSTGANASRDAGSAATPARQSCVTARVSSSPAQPCAIRMWNGCAASAPAKRCRCGREESLDTLMATILRDRPFFERSGGGHPLRRRALHAARVCRQPAGPLQGRGAAYCGGKLPARTLAPD